MSNHFKQRLTIWLNNQRLRVGSITQWLNSLNLGVRAKNVGVWIWKVMGSSHFANLLSFATLAVTIYLTLYVFSYANKQEEARVDVSVSISPERIPLDPKDYSGITENEWMISLNIHNFGPSDVVTSALFIQTSLIPDIELIGFDQKDWRAMASQPSWNNPPSTPFPSSNGNHVVVMDNFESGDNYSVQLIFRITGSRNIELLNKWNELGLKKVPDPRGGGYWFDRSEIDQEKYLELLRYFITRFSITGSKVYVTGDKP